MRRDQGALSTELAVLVPILIGLMLFVVYAGRTVKAESDVSHAVYEAARAASMAGNPVRAEQAAVAAVAFNIKEGVVACRTLDVSVDTTSFAPGGFVSVEVTCVADLSDLAMLSVPGSHTFSGTAVEVVDSYRADGGGLP